MSGSLEFRHITKIETHPCNSEGRAVVEDLADHISRTLGVKNSG